MDHHVRIATEGALVGSIVYHGFQLREYVKRRKIRVRPEVIPESNIETHLPVLKKLAEN